MKSVQYSSKTGLNPVFYSKSIGLYIHIPFCIQICRYCDFTKVRRSEVSRELLDQYHQALLTEIDYLFNTYDIQNISSVYFGGGTPSLYPKAGIEEILSRLRPFHSGNIEITLEADPKTIRKHSLIQLKNMGVNRISIGAQSFNSRALKELGRFHEPRDIFECYEDCREAGFNNLSLDLMFGIPDQTLQEWNFDLQTLVRLNPEHISLYNLTLARGTPFYRERNLLSFPDEKDQVRMYRKAHFYLAEKGYEHYEISNFSKKGYTSCHNTDFWNFKPYLGIGAGASSFIPPWRWENLHSPEKYIQTVSAFKRGSRKVRRLTGEEMKSDYVILQLRKAEGLNNKTYTTLFNSIPEVDFPGLRDEEIKSLIQFKKRIKLNLRGMILSNEVFQRLV